MARAVLKVNVEFQQQLPNPVSVLSDCSHRFQESDLAFLKRLLAEEGLFCWFEHEMTEGETLGRHRLVITGITGTNQPPLADTQLLMK